MPDEVVTLTISDILSIEISRDGKKNSKNMKKGIKVFYRSSDILSVGQKKE